MNSIDNSDLNTSADNLCRRSTVFDLEHHLWPVSYRHCQATYHSILSGLKSSNKSLAHSSEFTRTLLESQRCDRFTDMADLRFDITKYMNYDTVTRITKGKENEFDQMKNLKAVDSFFNWDKDLIKFRRGQLWSAMSFKSKMKYCLGMNYIWDLDLFDF